MIPLFVALYGPTASGKTRLSVELALGAARELGIDPIVVSADSRQVYKRLDIGTAKTSPSEMRGVPHEMLGVAEPTRKLELEDYVRQAKAHVDQAFAKGSVPIVVGGTGVYVSALMENWDVDQTGAVRDSMRRDFPRSLAADAYETLRRLDPKAAAGVHRNNYEGIVNALARAMSDSRQHAPEPPEPAEPPGRRLVLGLDPGPRIVDKAIARRYAQQVRSGLFDEVRDLAGRYGLEGSDHGLARQGNQVFHTIGYREYFEVAAERAKPVDRLDSEDLRNVGELVVSNTIAYSRRQRAWFRKLRNARMVRSVEDTLAAVRAAMKRR